MIFDKIYATIYYYFRCCMKKRKPTYTIYHDIDKHFEYDSLLEQDMPITNL